MKFWESLYKNFLALCVYSRVLIVVMIFFHLSIILPAVLAMRIKSR